MRKRAASRQSTNYQGEPAVLTKIGRRTARSAIARSAPPPPTPARPGTYPPPAGLAFFLLILVKLPVPWYDKLTFYIDRRFFHYVRREKNSPPGTPPTSSPPTRPGRRSSPRSRPWFAPSPAIRGGWVRAPIPCTNTSPARWRPGTGRPTCTATPPSAKTRTPE